MTQYVAAYPRHCERSEAIHSFFVWRHGLLRFARNDGRYDFAFSRHGVPEVCWKLFAPFKTEGAGNAGCALHPRSHVRIVQRTLHMSIQGSGEHPTFPAQWLYGLWRALPGDEFLVTPSLPASF